MTPCSEPDVQPRGPIIDILARCSLLNKTAGKEVSELREPAQVTSHLPVRLSRTLRRDVAGVTPQPRHDDIASYVV